MMKKHLFTAIICFFAVEAFSQFDWKYITSDKGVEFYWKCTKEFSSTAQYCSKLKLVNTNSYLVIVIVTPTFAVNSQQCTMKPSVTSRIPANSTEAGDFAGLSWYPGEAATCPSSISLDYEVKTESGANHAKVTTPEKSIKPEPAPSTPPLTFDWVLVTSGSKVDFYCRCSQTAAGKFLTEVKVVNNNSCKIKVSISPLFIVNEIQYSPGSKSLQLNEHSEAAGQQDGLAYTPGNGSACPTYKYINYTVTREDQGNNPQQQPNYQNNATNTPNNKPSATTNPANNNYYSQPSVDDRNAEIIAHNREVEKQRQQAKENYDLQMQQNKQIEDLRVNIYNSIDNALYGTPEEQQEKYERSQARRAEEKRQQEQQIENERIEEENRIRKQEEYRRAAEEERRIEEENERIEAEQLERRNTYYEYTIPAFSMPNKYKEASLAEVYYFYVVRTNDNNVSFSNLFPVRKLADNSWPYKIDIDNKLKNEAKATDYKLVGFFANMNTASSNQQQLIQSAQQEGFSVDMFNFKYKEYKEIKQDNPQPKPKTGNDFWNK